MFAAGSAPVLAGGFEAGAGAFGGLALFKLHFLKRTEDQRRRCRLGQIPPGHTRYGEVRIVPDLAIRFA